jgi:hypothetical protein
VLKPLWKADPHHPIFHLGPLARIRRLLRHITVQDAFQYLDSITLDLSTKRDREVFRDGIAFVLGKTFHTTIQAQALATRGLPPHICQSLATYIALPDSNPLEPPLYLYQSSDLPRAGIYFHLPVLARHFRSDLQAIHGRPPCAWCAAPDSEWGRHLLVCPKLPAHLLALRATVLESIFADIDPAHRHPQDTAFSPANLDRLYFLNWTGTSSRRKHRSDSDHQPNHLILRQALWFMRTCINSYSSIAGNLPDSTLPRVPPLPVYGRSPFLPAAPLAG